MLGSLTLCIFGLGAAVIFDRIEKGNAYRADTADGLPAMRAHWPSGLIAAVWFVLCLGGVWLLGQGIQSFEATVLTPLLTALDPAQANSPDVVHAIEVVTAVMLTIMLTAVVLVFALPLTMGYLHHRRVRAARETYIRQIRDYEGRNPLPTGAIDHGMLA